MKVKCSACHVVFSIPDERIPPGKIVRVPCPKCHNPIVAGAAAEAPPEAVGPAGEPVRSGPGGGVQQVTSSRFDMVEEASPAALVCVQDRALLDILGPILVAQGYHLREVADTVTACHWWEQNEYELAVVDDGPAPEDPKRHPVVAFARALPMNRRRKCLFCLISRTLQTMDGIRAFQLGLELIVHRKDLDRASLILNRAISEHRGTYAVFREVGEERGLI